MIYQTSLNKLQFPIKLTGSYLYLSSYLMIVKIGIKFREDLNRPYKRLHGFIGSFALFGWRILEENVPDY